MKTSDDADKFNLSLCLYTDQFYYNKANFGNNGLTQETIK